MVRMMSGLMAAAVAAAGVCATSDALAQEGAGTGAMLEERAAPYVFLRGDIAQIEGTAMKSAKAMRDAHNRLGSFEPKDMGASWVAYAALVAADTPAFADAIEAKTNKKKKREAFLSALRDNPAGVRDLDGANAAISAIRAVAARDATRINALGDRFIADAYRLQNEGWAKSKIPQSGSQRLKGSQAYAAQRSFPAATRTLHVRTKAGNVRPNLAADPAWTPEWSPTSTPPSEAERTGALMTRALVLAARYVTGDLQPGHMDAYAKSKPSTRCFVNARLNLDQCIAASRTPYEEAFCLGEHALNDVSYCVGWVANAGRPTTK